MSEMVEKVRAALSTDQMRSTLAAAGLEFEPAQDAFLEVYALAAIEAMPLAKLAQALSSTKTFLRMICDEIEADDDETVVAIKAIGPNGSRELAQVSLRQVIEQADAALSEVEG